MKLLFIGDIYGELGRDILKQQLPKLKRQGHFDFVVANAENTTHGRGLNKKHYHELQKLGIDALTMGNHVFAQSEIFDFIDQAQDIIRPANGHPNWPGSGIRLFEISGKTLGIINLLGSSAGLPAVNPFLAFDQLYQQYHEKCDMLLVDFHAEFTSEKIAFGYFVDGRAQICIGTHTHVQTADERILTHGCAFITDVGMTGPLDGVIGVKKDIIIQRFLKNYPMRFETATGSKQLNAVSIEIDVANQRAIKIERIHIEVTI